MVPFQPDLVWEESNVKDGAGSTGPRAASLTVSLGTLNQTEYEEWDVVE